MNEPVLLAHAVRGDRTAFDHLLAGHERSVLLLAWHLTGSTIEAEDVLQEVLVRAWRGLSGFAGAGSLRAWLRAITVRVTLDRRRAARRQVDVAGLPWDPAGELPPPDTDGWVEPFPDARLPVDGERALLETEVLELSFAALLQTRPPRGLARGDS